VGGAERLARATFHATAHPLDDGTSAAREVHEHAPAVDGVGAPVGELRGDQPVDHAGGGGRRQRGVGGDLAHAPPASAGEHQQDTPSVTTDALGGRDR
jgi:hypothetical protein